MVVSLTPGRLIVTIIRKPCNISRALHLGGGQGPSRLGGGGRPRETSPRASTVPLRSVANRSRRPETIRESVACSDGFLSRRLYRVSVNRPARAISCPSMIPAPLKVVSESPCDTRSTRLELPSGLDEAAVLDRLGLLEHDHYGRKSSMSRIGQAPAWVRARASARPASRGEVISEVFLGEREVLHRDEGLAALQFGDPVDQDKSHGRPQEWRGSHRREWRPGRPGSGAIPREVTDCRERLAPDNRRFSDEQLIDPNPLRLPVFCSLHRKTSGSNYSF